MDNCLGCGKPMAKHNGPADESVLYCYSFDSGRTEKYQPPKDPLAVCPVVCKNCGKPQTDEIHAMGLLVSEGQEWCRWVPLEPCRKCGNPHGYGSFVRDFDNPGYACSKCGEPEYRDTEPEPSPLAGDVVVGEKEIKSLSWREYDENGNETHGESMDWEFDGPEVEILLSDLDPEAQRLYRLGGKWEELKARFSNQTDYESWMAHELRAKMESMEREAE